MDIIAQRLIVKDWPLKRPGDEKYFGYLVALGSFPVEHNERALNYADFCTGSGYSRYRLPYCLKLQNELFKFLKLNMQMAVAGDSMYGKLCIKLAANGYVVSLP